jgi:hypothetical protein
MRSPQKTRIKFTSLDYSVYSAAWLALFKDTKRKYPQYNFSTGQMRTLCIIHGLRALYKGVNSSLGYSIHQIHMLSGQHEDRIKWMTAKLTADGLLTEELECGPKRTIRRYKLTRKGQAIVDQMVDMDIVHERIIDILYGRRLLKH